MSQIKTRLYLTVLTLSLSLSGCGDNNSNVIFSSDSGKHLPGWATGHRVFAKAEQETCFECHGEDLKGGITNTSCFSVNSPLFSCHLGINAPSVHPEQWGQNDTYPFGQYAYARHKSYVATNGTAACANAACHGPALTGVTGSGSSCVTECHMGGVAAKHPAAWTLFSSHANYLKANANDHAKCSTDACHGAVSTGVFLSGPSCYQCHMGGISAVHPATADWRNTDHKGYTVPGLTIDATRAKCDIAACHGSFNDATKPGQVKVDKTCGASSCHAGDKN